MNRPAEREARYEDLSELPDHLLGEILHGQLITQPRPAPKHAYAASGIGGGLVPIYGHGRGGPGGGSGCQPFPKKPISAPSAEPGLARRKGGAFHCLKQAGFEALLANEWIAEYAQTYQLNHPNTKKVKQ